ncbi:MAG: hypothetical protein Q7T55_25320 [Solirubrobacteraceae bacterium]|nr:hypothetical protein [Solirubrobacteraceae bacterium]
MRPLLVAVLTLAAAGLAASPASAGILQPDQEIAALNGQRALNGIPGDVVENPGFSAGCAAHMAYIQANGGILDHDEDPTKPGYTEEGKNAGGTSVLTGSGSSFWSDGRNDFQSAPIHFMQMMNPFIASSGAADGCLTTIRDLSRPFAASQTFSFPGDGGVGLASEKAFEGPFVPGAFVGLSTPGNPTVGTTTGQHLYFFAAKAGAGWYGSLGNIVSASLKRKDTNEQLAVRTVDNTTVGTADPVKGQNLGLYLSPGGIVIPVQPLVVGATYEATVNFHFSSDATDPSIPSIARTWSFKAASKLPLPTVPASTRVPVVAATPVPTPVPVPVPTPTPAPVPNLGNGADLPPVGLSNAKLTKTKLTVTGSREAPVWVTIEAKKVTGKGKKRKTKYVFREALSITVKAGVPITVTHKRLPKGDYRITFRRGGAKGVVELQKTVKIK